MVIQEIVYMVNLTCPECSGTFGINSESVTTKEQVEGCTFDCPRCSTLLVMCDGVVRNFHAAMHEQDTRWPADGSGTGYAEFG